MIDLPTASRVAVAMSGGVDSSVVAALLVEAGYEVIGLTARLYDLDPATLPRAASCCAPDDARDARRVARELGIRHYVVDEREAFREAVIAPFEAAWRDARTPNPCVDCNRVLKFDRLVRHARGLGAAALATGHYARLDRDIEGRPRLRRGLDAGKDQAYFLYPLTPAAARWMRFPLGELTKVEVRGHARRLGLPVAEKRESMDICFVGGRRPSEHVRARPGLMVDLAGRRLGAHDNLAAFTIGQRRRLGLPTPSDRAEPRYVVDKRIDGTVVIGPAAALRVAGLEIRGYSSVPGPAPRVGEELEVQVRHRGPAVKALVQAVSEGGARVGLRLIAELFAAARGQSAVLWRGDRLLGGGPIEAVVPANPGPRAEPSGPASVCGASR